MSHLVDYEEMLKSFRCQDLANLLACFGQSKNGKKCELLDRCIGLLRRQPAIQHKIKEIHNSRLASTNCYTNLMNPTSSSSTSNSPDPMSLRFGGSSGMSEQMLAFNQSTGFGYPNLGLTSNCFPQTRQMGSNQTLIRIQFEKLAFYEFIAEVNSAIRLVGISPNARPLSLAFNFSLNQEQINEILNNRSMINGKFEHVKQVHLRFGYYESANQKDNLPANLVVNINQKPAQLPTPKPTSKPNADIIRPGRSIDITHLIRLAPNITNKVDLNWTNLDPNKTHCVGVYFFRKVTVQSLVDYLKTNKTIDGEQTKKMIREKLQISDSDFEIETNYYKVSLHCPLMKIRIQIPTRATTCKHVQCFDLESFLMMNEKKPTWLCPVCDQYSPFDNLIIDSLFRDILQKCSDCEEIQFNADAQWTKIAKEKEKPKSSNSNSDYNKHLKSDNETKSPTKLSSSNSSSKIIEASIVDICENDSLEDTVKKVEQDTETVPESDTTKKKEVVIDLTLDSDDEDSGAKTAQAPVPQLKQSSSMNQNQSFNESLNETDNPISPSVSIISLSSNESNSPKQTPPNDPNKNRPQIQNQKVRQPLSVDTIRNPALTSPVSSVGSNGSNLNDNLMNASPIINTPPASINSESYNSRLARDISSPKRPQNIDPNVMPKQTPSLASFESINNTIMSASLNCVPQQPKNSSNRPVNNQVNHSVPINSNRVSNPQSSTSSNHTNQNKPHGLINSNNKIQKPISNRHEYLTKEKAQLINEQVRPSRSPGLMDIDPSSIYRLKEQSIGTKMATQLARIESELNSGRTNRMGPQQIAPQLMGQQPFFLNNKSIPNGTINGMNGMNGMGQIRQNGTSNKMHNQINHPNMGYNSNQRVHHHQYPIPPSQSQPQQTHQQHQHQHQQQQQQYHSHNYT